MSQRPLFGKSYPEIDSEFRSMERINLSQGAWLEISRGWLSGHSTLFDILSAQVPWKSELRLMYDRTVDVPRRYAVLTERTLSALHPVLGAMRTALDARYQTTFDRASVALYRDGRDSVAFHGDYVARRMPNALVATISVGDPRKFLLRPSGGGPSIGLTLGWGDLLVMEGSCQRTYQHAIPKVARAQPRIAIMFRPQWEAEDDDAPPTNEQAANR